MPKRLRQARWNRKIVRILISLGYIIKDDLDMYKHNPKIPLSQQCSRSSGSYLGAQMVLSIDLRHSE